ncbi:unnamed protein product [Clavelina lepadiformis]|uniref:Agrin n=1 Tax=Clavelina lepadiformis TaxID=159417 RepID=A0ABP0GAL9_CLALP
MDDAYSSRVLPDRDSSHFGMEMTPHVREYEEDLEWSTPQFGGASYLEFEKLPSSVFSAITITMSFRTFDAEGLLFFSAQRELNRDFISLAVKQGYVEFRFDTGSGPLRLRSRRPVDDGGWHKIVARRNRRDGMLMLDDDSGVQGTAPGKTAGLNLHINVYVGGYTFNMEERIRDQAGVNKGLTGCIRSLAVDEDKLLGAPTPSKCIGSSRIAECSWSPCFPNPCNNSADCFITRQGDRFTNKCQCKDKFEGPRCEREVMEKKIDPCASNPCHPSANCSSATDQDGFNCICPPGRSDSLCNTVTHSPAYMPSFVGDSYIQRESLGSTVKSRMEIEVLFYCRQPDGLIFYNGQKKSGKGDFVALNLRDGHLEFLYNLGQGIATIRSTSPVTLGDWHLARVSRDMTRGEMSVDGGVPERGRSPGENFHLNVKLPLYLGGVPQYNKMLRSYGIRNGLDGALQKFTVNGMNIPLFVDNLTNTSYNVQPFNGHACYHNPCLNGGACLPNRAEYSCACAPRHVGERCEEESIDLLSDQVLRDQSESGVYFDGKAKAMYNNYVKSISRSLRHNAYQIRIRTKRPHGLLLMAGKARRTDRMSGDYLALAVTDGKVHLRYDLGSGPAHVISDDRIDNGEWTTINVERIDKEATLQVNNGLVQHVTSPGKTRKLNTDGFLWLGGIDYQPRGIGLYKSFFHSFVGCVSRFMVHGEEILLREDALNSPDLPSCS